MDKQLEMLMLRIDTLPDSHRLTRALEVVERNAAESSAKGGRGNSLTEHDRRLGRV